jgi:hypothetical protein
LRPSAIVSAVGTLSAGIGTGGNPSGTLIATTAPIGLSFSELPHPTSRARMPTIIALFNFDALISRGFLRGDLVKM